ncbi:hypothetical protein CALVIDRAFT_541136 [Calocera viscosa TUFC12733]|uniref:N-acetyltransferase domain-containing protein n=1 Tax=Calocera viscosa (strain TUFC12733) TaxID=1330018 RepID=A0A167I570_CALVF|nr:hypothetical protein CALVIDRAFT_541136 [Calocera viscosa TUFC12733]
MVTLCSPKHSTSLSPDWLAPRMQLLASSLYSLISSGAQPAMTSITGATALTSAFTPLYASLSGIAPDGPAVMETLHTHCPRARVDLKPPRLPEGHAIHVVQRGDKIALAQLAKLLQDFRAHHGGPGAYISLEQATKQAEVGIRFNEFMVYSVTDAEGKEEYAGYVRDGRITSKHTSVRNVFILPHHRRKGIAEVLTRAAVVRMLSQPNRMKEALASLLPAGADCTIDDAQIFAEKSNLSAQGIYSRVGYGFPAGEWDEEDGKSWEDCVELGYPGNPGH